jgi:hypothetical protein
MKTKLILPVLCGAVLALASGCAAPGAPQPPSLRLPRPVDNLSAVRTGDRVILTWTPPLETTDHLLLRWPTTTYICRVPNQFPIARCGEPVERIPGSELVSVAPGARRPLVSFEDVLPPSLIAPPGEAAESVVTYAIEVVNRRGRSAGLSNQVLISLAPAVPPPVDLRASLDAEGPLLQWEMGAMPPLPAGVSCVLRIDRRTTAGAQAAAFEPVAQQPCHAGPDEIRDLSFEWERTYEYKAAAVLVIDTPGRPILKVTGDDSATVSLVAHDIFPPAVPTGLEAVFSSVGQKPFIDLTWAPDTESDLSGYIVYRRTPGTKFVAVSPSPLKAPAWRDSDVKPGESYIYAVSAIDVRGNESAKSAPASERVPAEVR